MVAAAVCERGRARCGFRFVSHSRYRPGWLAVWVVGCGRRKEGQVHFHFHLPSGLLRARFAKVCRLLSLSLHSIPYCSCALRSSFVCHNPRRVCNLSPPADSTTPALPCPPPLRSTACSRAATPTTSDHIEPRQYRIPQPARHNTATRGLDESLKNVKSAQ